ncbi:hypothetical protein OC835_006607 [Tilletia horrida]|nr:hypothetical protein OC835_006607 [Tilletia horrida]
MPPKGGKGNAGRTGSLPSSAASQPLVNVPWPHLKAKNLPPPEWLIPDQVCLLPAFLSADECKAIINLFEPASSPPSNGGAPSASGKKGAVGGKSDTSPSSASTFALLPSPPAKKGEAVRTNYRASTVDRDFAQTLYGIGLDKAVEDWPSLDRPRKDGTTKHPAGLHANIRIYRYDPGCIFGPHYDQCSTCPATGLASEWTLLIYLSGPESGLSGGQTVFYDRHSVNSPTKWEVEPRSGMALLHRHGSACMLHAALPPLTGKKWVLRSDLLFR